MTIRLRDRVVILNPSSGEDDAHGAPSEVWPEVGPVEPAGVEPLSSDESVLQQDRVLERWKVRLHPLSVATDKSRVRWPVDAAGVGGDLYAVDGKVFTRTDARGRGHHKTAYLVRVTGG